MIICIQSPSRLLMMQDQKSLTRRWLSCSGWSKDRVSLVFSYKGCRFIQKGQWCAKVNILRLTVGYLNATINRKTRNTEPVMGTNGSSKTRQNPWVEWYGCGWGFWIVLEPNRTVFPDQIQTAGAFPGPVANTRSTPLTSPRLPKPSSEFTYVTALSFLPSTIDGWVLTPMSINYVIKVMSLYCVPIAIGNTW